MCDLSRNLQIFVVTYNRYKYLAKTLESIFDKKSPIRNLNISILDNCSNDGSSNLISEYCKKYINIQHIRHSRNIGGNANICRALELARLKYFWILCDDDSYDWTYWNEVEEGIKKDYDVILTERKINITNFEDYPNILNTTSFLPSAIYRTDILNNDVIQNAYANIMYSFPHFAVSCAALNQKRKFYVPKNTIIIQRCYSDFTRGYEEDIHPRVKYINLFTGYINSYQMIKDKKIRFQCIDVLWVGKSFFESMCFMNSQGMYIYNLCDIFNGINGKQKILFLLSIIYIYVPKLYFKKNSIYIRINKNIKFKIWNRNIINIYSIHNDVRISIFNKIKFKMFKYKIK